MIIEFQPKRTLLSSPPKWKLYYKTYEELEWNVIYVTYDVLKLFLEKYGYESQDILLLQQFGVDTTNIKYINNTTK